jgi:hypothetical protein
LFVAEDQFRALSKTNAEIEKKLTTAETSLIAAELEKEGMRKEIEELKKQAAENKTDADFSLFVGRVSMLKDIEKDKATYVLADQLATLRREVPQHAEEIEEVFGPDQPAEGHAATRESRTVGQHAAGPVAEDPSVAAEQEAHSDPEAK